MVLSNSQKTRLIESNQSEYGDRYEPLRFVADEQAASAEHERSVLLAALQGRAVFCCKETKVDGGNLSRGCQICTEGHWSCLFINSRCNCRCFYCPAEQDEDILPTTNTVPFPDVDDYISYIDKFRFTGVSLSGGEPLLALKEALHYIQSVKQEFGGTVYTWLYTNGVFATRDTLVKLKEAGLDEIRFDIGATGMSLEAAKRAVDILDVVTVEIPALPEEFETMKLKMRKMESAGIQHLNLHQLRLTPHNYPHLLKRGYTFVHGAKVTVLESELMALRLIQWAHDEGIRLPVNYCSFVYKNRFQRAAARKKSAALIRKPCEDITENGYIRTVEFHGGADQIDRLQEIFQNQTNVKDLWKIDSQKTKIQAASPLWPFIDFSRFQAGVTYSEAKIVPSLSSRNVFVKVPLNSGRDIYIEKILRTEKILLDAETAGRLVSRTVNNEESISNIRSNPVWERICEYEWIEKELGEYF